ncbi:hypothetical protein [Rhizobium leguminosarum]|uniref:Uncharacterized protein n=1 Tax=Rhizobium leguminosarum TaxID=384 RepID=A0A7M3DQI8_RHILE|nr:hypothetical protein [Rhizobium leguminosarum]TAY50955.1 hypothetical protein ELH90_04145 [Rhizobium leguminosarum]
MSRQELIDYLRKLSNKDVPITDSPVPDAVNKAARLQANGPSRSEDDYTSTLQAWSAFCQRFHGTKNKRHRTVMQQVANFALTGEMGIAYVLTTGLEQALKAERRARRGLYPNALYSVVGDGIAAGLNWKSINVQTGASPYRMSGEEKVFRGRYEDWTATEILGAHIEIGKHTLHVGTTVPKILAALEDRYGIDFKELEKQRRLQK